MVYSHNFFGGGPVFSLLTLAFLSQICMLIFVPFTSIIISLRQHSILKTFYKCQSINTWAPALNILRGKSFVLNGKVTAVC